MEEMKTIIKQLDPIKEEILSVRALNCCKKIGVTNMFELRDFVNSNNLLNVRNCGQKTILELQEALNRFSFVEISKYDLIPLVTHYIDGYYTTYRLDEYTDELASEHKISRTNEFSTKILWDLYYEIIGRDVNKK